MKAYIVGLGAALSLCGPAVAWSDPISLIASGGGAFIEWDGSSATLDLSGDGFRIQAGGTGGGSAGLASGFAGETVSLSGGIGASPLWMGTAVINGTTLSIPGGPVGPVWRGFITLTTTPFVLPTVPDGLVTVRTRLTVNGEFGAYQSLSPNAPELFSIAVSGSGTASATVRSTTLPDGRHRVTENVQGNSYGWTATPSATNPAPTPEPASLLLLATGVAGVALRRARQQRDN